MATDSIGPVPALRLSTHAVSRPVRRDAFAALLWPVPALFAVGAVGAALLSTWLDERLLLSPGAMRLVVADTDTAVTLTSVVASGMLAFLGIVFSTTLVAIQLSGSQYSPRAVRVFVRSKTTKITLGVFIGTFLFAIATLIDIRSTNAQHQAFLPVITMTVLSALIVATVAMFLAFVHGTSRLLRVQYLIERITRDSRTTICASFPRSDRYVPAVTPKGPAGAYLATTGSHHGVIEGVDLARVGQMATEIDGWIELLVPIGTYVPVDTPIAVVHGRGPGHPGELMRSLRLGSERTMVQDPGFGIRQLVDISIRALSPAVNDPTTAAQVLDRLTDLFARLAGLPDPTGWYADDEGTLRVRLPVDTFDGLVRLAFTEIIWYGADSPQVVRRLLASFDRLERDPDAQRRSTAESMREQLLQAVANSSTVLVDGVIEPDPRGLG